MRQWFISTMTGLALLLALPLTAAAQQAEIEGTINSQIEAFKSDDFEQAFSFATPGLQRLFRSPENFERMVTQGYPMVWRPADVEYLELAERGGEQWQKVRIVDQKGFAHLLLYRMIETPEGWRIGGVQLLKNPGATA